MTKRYIRILIGIIITAVIALGAYAGVSIYNKSKNDKLLEESEKLNIFNFNEKSISEIKIHNASGDYEFKRENNEWMMTQGDNIAISSYKLSSISDTISTLKADSILNEGQEVNYEKYGLNNSMVITAVVSDGKEYSVEVGNQVPGDSRYYARKSGDNVVYLIASQYADILWSEKNDLKDTYMFDVSNANQITYLKYKCAGETIYELSKEDNKWQILDPCPSLTVNNSGVESILLEVIRASCVTFIDEDDKDLSAYGLDNPSYEIAVKTADKEAEFIFGDYYDEEEQYIYAQNKGTGQIYVFQTGSLGCIGTKTEDVLFRLLHSVAFINMDTFDIDMFGQKIDITYHYSITDNLQNDFVINGKKIDVTDEEILEAFNNLINSVIGMAYDNICEVSDELVLDNEPEAYITYHMMDDSEYKLEFIADTTDEEVLYIIANGKFTGTSINASTLKNGVSRYYEDLMDLLK